LSDSPIPRFASLYFCTRFCRRCGLLPSHPKHADATPRPLHGYVSDMQAPEQTPLALGSSIHYPWSAMFSLEYSIVPLCPHDVECYCIFLWQRCTGGNGVVACFDG
jgi:hypothetical protein